MIELRETTNEDLANAHIHCLPIFIDASPTLLPGMVTVFTGESILAVFSANRIWDGVVLFGAILTERVYAHPVAFVRIIKKYLREFEQKGIHRMQMDVPTEYEAGHRFAKALGFKAEGVMKMFGPTKKDYTLYARTHE